MKYVNGDPTKYAKLYFNAAGVRPFGKMGFGKFLKCMSIETGEPFDQLRCKGKISIFIPCHSQELNSFANGFVSRLYLFELKFYNERVCLLHIYTFSPTQKYYAGIQIVCMVFKFTTVASVELKSLFFVILLVH